MKKNLTQENAELIAKNEQLTKELAHLNTMLKAADRVVLDLAAEIKRLSQSMYKIDFKNPIEAARDVFKLLCHESCYNRVEFTKQLSAGVYRKLQREIESQNKELELQKNAVKFNICQLDKLQKICDEISQDAVVFEPKEDRERR